MLTNRQDLAKPAPKRNRLSPSSYLTISIDETDSCASDSSAGVTSVAWTSGDVELAASSDDEFSDELLSTEGGAALCPLSADSVLLVSSEADGASPELLPVLFCRNPLGQFSKGVSVVYW